MSFVMEERRINSEKRNDHQRRLETIFGFSHQICSLGIVDILTPNKIIFIGKFSECYDIIAIVTVYAYIFPEHNKQVYFYGPDPENIKAKLKMAIQSLEIIYSDYLMSGEDIFHSSL